MSYKSNIALIYGGSSSERDISIDGGKRVYAAIDKDRYNVVVYDPSTDLQKLVNEAYKLDFAFIALHGSGGEDGTIQGLLDLLGVPYQGSGVLGSSVAMNKITSKRLFQSSGLLVAPYIIFNYSKDVVDDKLVTEVEDNIGFPIVVKPSATGSSIGVSVVKCKKDFFTAISEAAKYANFILIEAYIEGIELTCGVLGNNKLEMLPVVEIVHSCEHVFFDYEAKYSRGIVEEICPARVSNQLTKKAQLYAKIAHNVLFCRGYSRTDMILKNDNLYILETNTIPGMSYDSLYPKAALFKGISFSALVEKLITLGLEEI